MFKMLNFVNNFLIIFEGSGSTDTVPDSDAPSSEAPPHPQALAMLLDLATVLPNNTQLPPDDVLSAVRSLTFLLTSINQPQPPGAHNVTGLNLAMQLRNITAPQQRPLVITVTSSHVKVSKPYTKNGPPSAR